MTRSSAGGHPGGCFASLELNDNTGATVTVTTGGTFQPVLHASLLTAGVASKDASLTVDGTAGTITVPAGKLGKYEFVATGLLLGANSEVVQLRPALAGAAFASGKGAKIATRVTAAASAVDQAFSCHGILNVDAAGAVSLQVTTTTNATAVIFKRLAWSLKLLEA
jgi:hypothetical protein